MFDRRRLRCAAAGFTLLEMAIAVALFGMITSGALLGVSAYFKRQAQVETAALLPRIERAITLYVIQNGELPCPDTTVDGESDPTVCTTAAAGGVVQGVVPWRTLGLQREEVVDAWKHYVDLVVSVDVSSGTLALKCNNNVIDYASVAASGAIEVTDNPAVVWTGPLAAYALISHGANGFGGLLVGGNAFKTAGASIPEVHHAQTGERTASGGLADTVLISGFNAAYGNMTGEFDDVLRSRTPAQILYDMGCING